MAHLPSNVRDLIVSISKFQFSINLKMYLFKDAETGAPLPTLFAQVALFAASLCLWETGLCSEYDHSGIKTMILYHICTVLLCYTNRWSRLGLFRRKCSVKLNSIANLTCLILGILLEKFYEKSLASLCFALSIAVLFLILVVIIQPRTDLGFFGFLIGVSLSVAYKLFQFKLGTWIVVAICFVLLCFKRWLDKNWLELELEVQEHDNIFLLPVYLSETINSSLSNPLPVPVIQSTDVLIVAAFYLVWASAFLSTNCLNLESCTSCSAMEKLKCGAFYGFWLCPAYIHRVYSLLQVEFWVFWPTTMPYTKAIVKMEYILNNIKRLKKAHRPRDRYAIEEVMIYIVHNGDRMREDHLLIRELRRPEVMTGLQKWMRKRIENKILKIQQEIIAQMCKNPSEVVSLFEVVLERLIVGAFIC